MSYISFQEADTTVWYFYPNPKDDIVLPRRPRQWTYVREAPEDLKRRGMDLRARLVAAQILER